MSVPDHLYDKLDREFGFTISTTDFESNPLARRWRGIVWCHPPTGRSIGRWVRKAYLEAQKGATVICLLPSSTDTTWWHDFVMKAEQIRFLKGRLRFKGHSGTAPFASVVVIFSPHEGGPTVSAMQGYTR